MPVPANWTSRAKLWASGRKSRTRSCPAKSPFDAGQHVDHDLEVALRQEAALRRAGRTRRVEDGQEVVRSDRATRGVERAGLLRSERAAAVSQLVEADRAGRLLDRHDAIERFELRSQGRDLRELLL
jgi:hypothetical protein